MKKGFDIFDIILFPYIRFFKHRKRVYFKYTCIQRIPQRFNSEAEILSKLISF